MKKSLFIVLVGLLVTTSAYATLDVFNLTSNRISIGGGTTDLCSYSVSLEPGESHRFYSYSGPRVTAVCWVQGSGQTRQRYIINVGNVVDKGAYQLKIMNDGSCKHNFDGAFKVVNAKGLGR